MTAFVTVSIDYIGNNSADEGEEESSSVITDCFAFAGDFDSSIGDSIREIIKDRGKYVEQIPPHRYSGFSVHRIHDYKQTYDSLHGIDTVLLNKLYDLRRELSAKHAITEGMILNVSLIIALARLQPLVWSELATVFGMGRNKLNHFGLPILGVIRDHVHPDEHSAQLYEDLLGLRYDLSRSLGVDQHSIMSAEQLGMLLENQPLNRAKFIKLTGMAEDKFLVYGQALLSTLMRDAA